VSARRDRTAEELRRSALVLLGDQGDAHAIELLAHAGLSVARAIARWDSSSGPVEGHRVTLALDASQLGELRANPAAYDAICAALATAIAMDPGESLHELVTRWAPDAHAAAAGYRDAPPSKVTLKDALVAYLESAGSTPLADALRQATVEQTRAGDVIVRGLSGDGGSSLSELTRAVRDLLGSGAVRVRIED
jgi:hypothetical protein